MDNQKCEQCHDAPLGGYRSAAHNQHVDGRMLLMRGVAAVAVCVGHVSPMELSGPYGLLPPYSYQVAAFVFVSGYFYRADSERHPIRYVSHRARRLLLPLLAVNAVYGIIWCILKAAFGLSGGEGLSGRSILIDPLVSGNGFVINASMWFVAPLFFAEIISMTLRALVRRLARRQTDVLLCLASFVAGGFVVSVGGDVGLEPGAELALCRLIFFLPWFNLGQLYKTFLEKHDVLPNSTVMLGALLGQLAVTFVAGEPVVYNVAWCRFYHGPALTYITTLLSLAFVLRLCRICGSLLEGLPLMRTIGANSFSVMCHHQAGYLLLTAIVVATRLVLGVPAKFDFAGLLAHPTTSFVMLDELPQFALVYVMVGVAFSLAIHAVWRRLEGGLRSCLTALGAGFGEVLGN